MTWLLAHGSKFKYQAGASGFPQSLPLLCLSFSFHSASYSLCAIQVEAVIPPNTQL